MDHIALLERNYEVDLESGCTVSEESSSSEETNPGVRKQAKNLLAKVCSRFVDGSIKGEERVGLCGGNVLNVNGEKVKVVEERKDDEGKKAVKEKSKKSSNKKAPKPPKPPRGPSLDAADQKLIREISELAMLKRARVERMRALRKMKAAKQSSSNSNLFAMVFTVIFCLVILFQGMSSSGTPVSFQGSPMSTDTTEGALISVQFSGNPSSDLNGPDYVSPNLVEQVAGSDPREKLNRAAG
ncbi:hypothetical protein Dsin_027723 [Dipteronia sinensis]|uniref:Transmembrane protein n=1 Tax=Dipteronia sinensis TaxID=43782 RepID=A0AAD9ZPI0_9ROSI|nr:hypothetical protein Dsin_027723 [Dipteronia sinensis]